MCLALDTPPRDFCIMTLNALYFDALSGLTNNFSWHFRRNQEKISSNRYCVHHSTLCLRQSFFLTQRPYAQPSRRSTSEWSQKILEIAL